MTAACSRRPRSASTASRAFAACFGLWFVACVFLGARHEAEIAHVIEDGTGRVLHASHLSDHHDARSPADVHRRDESGVEHGVCTLSAALHQAASDDVARPSGLVAAAAAGLIAYPAHGIVRVERGVYRLAPKTSPPTIG